MSSAAQPDAILSPHFRLSEFTTSQAAVRMGLRNDPGSVELENLRRLAGVLEHVRTLLGGAPIVISSGYRAPLVNAAVGGARDSAHLAGRAVDFIAPSFGDPRAICRRLVNRGALYDQLIYERSWVHIGIAAEGALTRCQVLTATFEAGKPTRYQLGIC